MYTRFSKNIEDKNWDHLKYLQRLTMALVLIIMLVYVWILITSFNGIFEIEIAQQTLRTLTLSLIIGIITGLLIAFLELAKYYFNKEWDLHVVLPNFLFFHLLLTFIVMVTSYFVNEDTTWNAGLVYGFVLGGLIAMVAYAGEIKIEHSEDESKGLAE